MDGEEIKKNDIENKEITFSIEGKTYNGFLREERLVNFSRDINSMARIHKIGFLSVIKPVTKIPPFEYFKTVTIGDISSDFYMGDNGTLIEVSPRTERY